MKLIVGLGNYGKEYENTRHNIGFKAIDLFAGKLGVELNNEKFKGVFYKGDGFILAKPLTYMNLSGEFVQPLAAFFKIEPQDILVIYDDMDLPIGELRFRIKGSSGGQNGIKNIINLMGTEDIPRLKIGIGRPQHGSVDHVLGKFTAEEAKLFDAKKDDILKRIQDFIKG